jgi:hypothetical protein
VLNSFKCVDASRVAEIFLPTCLIIVSLLSKSLCAFWYRRELARNPSTLSAEREELPEDIEENNWVYNVEGSLILDWLIVALRGFSERSNAADGGAELSRGDT